MTGGTCRPFDGAMLRAATDGDADLLRRLAVDNGLFEADDMEDFDEMLAGYLGGILLEHRWMILDDGQGGVRGAAYYAPEPFSDRLWNLYFIAVSADQHRSGVGSVLIGHVEDELRTRGTGVARVLIVETSGLDGFEQARSFYREHGFEEEARVREFYGPGDDKVVFWKSLMPEASG